MSHPQPTTESEHELTEHEHDPRHHAIVPFDEQQDLAFRSIRAIDPRALEPYGPVSRAAVQRTPRGLRPMIWINLAETGKTVVFQVTLHTGQCIQVYVLTESWILGKCDSEAVRAAIQSAYLNLLLHKPDSGIVRPGTVCRKILPMHDPHIGYIDKIVDRVKKWRNHKLRRRQQTNKPGAFHRAERMGGDTGGGEAGNRSGSGSGSGELAYSESRSSASSYASENSASEHAVEPSTSTMWKKSTRPATQETRPSSHASSNKDALTHGTRFPCEVESCGVTFFRQADLRKHVKHKHRGAA